MNENTFMGTMSAGQKPGGVPRVEYFKLSPATKRYYRIMALASARGCRWQDVIRDAVDYYLERFSKQI